MMWLHIKAAYTYMNEDDGLGGNMEDGSFG